MLGELALESADDLSSGMTLKADIAGAADEEAEGFHSRRRFTPSPLRMYDVEQMNDARRIRRLGFLSGGGSR